MDRKYITLGLLLVLVVALVGVPEALARSGYLSDFNAKYGTANTKLDTCDTCHVPGGKARNPYGADMEAQLLAGATVDQALTNIEPKDSDGDTYSNIDEIKALTFPGDPNDPASTPTPTPTPTPSPTAIVTFKVTDNVTGLAVQNARVSMDGISIKTDATGTAVFTNVALGDHTYTVSKTGYRRYTGVVSVAGDTTVNVALVPR
jgi:hypothetical protein